MRIYSYRKIIIRKIAAIAFALSFYSLLSAEQPNSDYNKQEEKSLSIAQKQARGYREQGFLLQNGGSPEEAMAFYQKAIALDPLYAAPYNDLGIIYEARGSFDQAEELYLRAIQIDPGYLSSYTNIAYLYENKRQLDKAAYYWKKRIELGSPGDLWTDKAKERLEDLRFLTSDKLFQDDTYEIAELMKDMEIQKSIMKKDDKELARAYLNKAKVKLNNGDQVTALKIAIDASQLDPSNEEIEEFMDTLRSRLLSK